MRCIFVQNERDLLSFELAGECLCCSPTWAGQEKLTKCLQINIAYLLYLVSSSRKEIAELIFLSNCL